jgi:nucleotide-binding universal stress UspA family protein
VFRSAVAAIDLSPSLDPMIACLGDLRRWGVVRLSLVVVLRAGFGQVPGERALGDVRDSLRARANALAGEGIAVDVDIRVGGPAADGILQAASDFGADLMVVGSRSHNLASRMFLGSVARDLIRKTCVPLLLQWIEPATQPVACGIAPVCIDTLRRVLVATDFSRHAGAAERAAIALASLAERVDCMAVLTADAIEATPSLPLMARTALDALASRISAAGGRGEAFLVRGDPREAIGLEAAAHECSLIIVGKHGQHRIASMTIGSTAWRVCEQAGRPVLLVPYSGRWAAE